MKFERPESGIISTPDREGGQDAKRNGTTILFAALSMLDGQVVTPCRQRRRPVEARAPDNYVDKRATNQEAFAETTIVTAREPNLSSPACESH
jgi:hypothetical protein